MQAEVQQFASRRQVQSGASTPFKKWLLNFAVERKYAEVKEGVIRKNSVWDKLIFNKVQVLILVVLVMCAALWIILPLHSVNAHQSCAG